MRQWRLPASFDLFGLSREPPLAVILNCPFVTFGSGVLIVGLRKDNNNPVAPDRGSRSWDHGLTMVETIPLMARLNGELVNCWRASIQTSGPLPQLVPAGT